MIEDRSRDLRERIIKLMEIMPNRMDRGFFKYQNEFEAKALEVCGLAGMC